MLWGLQSSPYTLKILEAHVHNTNSVLSRYNYLWLRPLAIMQVNIAKVLLVHFIKHEELFYTIVTEYT